MWPQEPNCPQGWRAVAAPSTRIASSTRAAGASRSGRAVEVADSARKHRISDSSTIHAWENATKFAEFDYEGEERLFVIGPDSSGNLLELIAVPGQGPTRIMHAA